MRRVDEYLMQTAIVANPHKEADAAKEFVEQLLDQRRFMRGDEDVPEQLDLAGFEAMRKQLANESITIKVK